jgi:phospholipase C
MPVLRTLQPEEENRMSTHTRPAVAACAALLILGALVVSQAASASSAGPTGRGPLAGSPIKHVVVIYQENHSFNDILGRLCVDENNRCEGTTTGMLHTGVTYALKPESDTPGLVPHRHKDMVIAIDKGKMDGFDIMPGSNDGSSGFVKGSCAKKDGYPCLVQIQPGGLPNLWSLADTYVISDRTFETATSASWGSHLDLVSTTLDGFVGDQPRGGPGPGAGCDSLGDAWWRDGNGPKTLVPACIPDKNGKGPYRASPVKYVPTIMDRLDAAGDSWKLYAPGRKTQGYGWAICPSFYECLGSSQWQNVKNPADFAKDATSGKLPAFSVLVPYPQNSQHPQWSMIQGDDWIARNVQAVMDGPDWSSTAIFITYDDCGCFYDEVPPPKGLGIRVPMVIVSPYAKARFVDHQTASLASILAFTEGVFGLQPLSKIDQNAYDYSNAFNFAQKPLAPIRLVQHPVPESSLKFLATHPQDVEDDPT